jgi:hypothetical protein
MSLILKLTVFLLVSLIFVKDSYCGFFTCTEKNAKAMDLTSLKVSQKNDLNTCFKEFIKHPKYFTALMENSKNKTFCSRLLKYKDPKKKQPIHYLKLPRTSKAQVKSKKELYEICYAVFMASSHHKHIKKTKMNNEQIALREKLKEAESQSREEFKASKLSDEEEVGDSADTPEGAEDGEGGGASTEDVEDEEERAF